MAGHLATSGAGQAHLHVWKGCTATSKVITVALLQQKAWNEPTLTTGDQFSELQGLLQWKTTQLSYKE